MQARAALLLGGPATAKRWTSQITPPSPAVRGETTPVSQAGYRRLVPGKGQNLTLLSIELHADTRCGALPLRAHRHVALIIVMSCSSSWRRSI